jgi:hypothetical protein
VHINANSHILSQQKLAFGSYSPGQIQRFEQHCFRVIHVVTVTEVNYVHRSMHISATVSRELSYDDGEGRGEGPGSLGCIKNLQK